MKNRDYLKTIKFAAIFNAKWRIIKIENFKML